METVKVIELARKYNIGLSTLTEFLTNCGYSITEPYAKARVPVTVCPLLDQKFGNEDLEKLIIVKRNNGAESAANNRCYDHVNTSNTTRNDMNQLKGNNSASVKSLSDFECLRSAGFVRSYECIEIALRFFFREPSIACNQFRKFLESVVQDTLGILGAEPSNHLTKDLKNLETLLPETLLPDEIRAEMDTMRIIGNKYAHIQDGKPQHPEGDRTTCYVAAKKITKWLVDLKETDPEYLRRELEQKAKERRKRNMRRTLFDIAIMIMDSISKAHSHKNR